MVSPDFAREVIRAEILKQDRGAAALRAAQVNSVAQQHQGKQDHLRVAAGGDKFSGLIRYHKIAVKAQPGFRHGSVTGGCPSLTSQERCINGRV